jgi:SAM-dependent methyltransferase
VAENTYDVLPYEDFTFPQTHPEHLYCLTGFLGHAAPHPSRARVLELGCASGANLVPIALDLPEGRFVGIDLSSQQIAEGRALVERLGITNVVLEARSIADLDIASASFDYVICHGVYSWVPDEVRAAILATCARVLAPNGVAYVSYNTMPGWSLGRTVRDYLLMHTAPDSSPRARVAAARAALTVFAEGLAARIDPASVALRHEVESLAHVGDSYLFHEYLEEANVAMYFRDFVDAARRAGLAYFADADPSSIVREALARRHDDPREAITHEQTVDFFRKRRFRASLLTRTDAGARAVQPDLSRVVSFHLASTVELAGDPAERTLHADAPLAFTHANGSFTLRDPIAKAAMVVLVEAVQRPVAFETVCDEVARRTRITDPVRIASALARELDLVDRVFDRTIELRAGPARYEIEASIRPIACPLARDQAARGSVVTNCRHAQLDVDAFTCALIPLLDGTRDRSALAARIAALPHAGDLADLDRSPGTLAGRIEGALDWLAANALLVG